MIKFRVDTSIIVPAHNEETLIKQFINDVDRACKNLNLSYEIVVVENGSHDRTWHYLQEISTKNQRVKLIQLRAAGYGLALCTGLKRCHGKYGVIFNVDFWDKKLLMLTKVDMLGHDLIVGSKNLSGSLDLRRFNRRMVTKAFNLFLRVFLGFKGTDTHGIKLLRLKTVLPIVKICKTRTGIFDSELVIRSQRKGLKILELPVVVEEVRPVRFGVKRLLQTPFDVCHLCMSLRK